jgi:hypothetical protein
MLIFDVWKDDDKPKEKLPPRQDVPTEQTFLLARMSAKSSAYYAAERMAREVNDDLLAYLYRTLAVTVDGRERVFWPLPVSQWPLAVARSHDRGRDGLPLAPSVNALLDRIERADDTLHQYSRDLPSRDTLLQTVGRYWEHGGLVVPRAVLDAAVDTFHFDDAGRATDSCTLELPMSSYPFVCASVHPDTAKEGWMVAHTRCVRSEVPKGGKYTWTSFVWFRDSVDEALRLAEYVLTLAETANEGPYDLPEERRARLPVFVDPLRLVLPFPDLRGS